MRQLLTVIFLASFAATFEQSIGFAQGPVVSVLSEPVGPDTGELVSSAASPGRVKCWVSRSTTGAVAISIYDDGSTLSAKFRRFSKEDEEYSSKKTKIQIPPSTPTGQPTVVADIATVPVRLVAVPGRDDTYKMVYESLVPNAQVDVGFVRFGRGNNKRASSDVVIRFKNIEGAIDPCSQPPIDDIGEEEEMPEGASANAPGPSLPFTAPIAP